MARTLENILGDHVVRQNGEKVAISSLCGKDRVLGIYFSAEWCPPCKGFTPKLVELYNKLKEKDSSKFEVVFVSWDRDEASFTEYFSTLPWLALPFTSDRKAKLCKKFRVHGIPKLVLIDAENGKTITCDGYTRAKEDENGLEFPWRRKKFTDIIKGKLLKEKKEVEALEELKGKIVGLYFAANWCPPCKGFTQELVRLYEKLKSNGKKFEVVFVSMDRSEDSFTSFANTMPWLAVPFDDARVQMLKSLYEVDGIPMLVMLDECGSVITLDGRLALNEDIEGQTTSLKPVVYGCPDHNSAPSVQTVLDDATVEVAFVTSPVHTNTPIGVPMDLYWSWVPGLPRKLYWPVRVISWDELKVKVFCKADNAILQFCSEYYSKSISDETDINENADDPMIDAGEPKDDEGVSKTIKSENCCIYDRQVALLCHKFHDVLMYSWMDGFVYWVIDFPWYPKPINELTEGSPIQLNESACLVLFVEPDDEEVDKARDLLLKPATEEHEKGEHRDLLFFIGADDELCDPVRVFANLGDQTPLLTILDFPEQKVYVSEEKNITTELVNTFVKGYLDGTLPSRPCRP